MKRFLTGMMIITAVICMSYSVCYGVPTTGDPTIYKVTIKQIKLKSVKGNWVTIATPNQEVDLRSAAANGLAGSLAASMNIPTDTYVNMMIVISNTIKAAGIDGGDGNQTGAGAIVTITGGQVADASSQTWTGGKPSTDTVAVDTDHAGHPSLVVGGGPGAEMTFVIKLGAAAGRTGSNIEISLITDLTTPIVVKDSSRVSMAFTFDTKNTVSNNGWLGPADAMVFWPPANGTAYNITVDGTVHTINATDMYLNFNL